jgi:ketosteroid isomerase-like protein
MKDMTNNESQIKTLIENWAQAVNNKDMDAILAFHSPDFVMYDVPEPFQSAGLDAYRQTWEYFFKWNKDQGFFKILDLQITADEHVAFCFSPMKCKGRDKNGELEELDFRLTVGLQKINNQWVIVHEHHSIPSPIE